MLASFELLIIDEPGFVTLVKTGAELLFEVFNRHDEELNVEMFLSVQ